MLQLHITGLVDLVSPYSDDEVIAAVEETIADFGLTISERMTLSSKFGSSHWHVRKADEARGVLEITYWPKRMELVVEIHRNRMQAWNAGVAGPFAEALAARLGLCVGDRIGEA